MSCEYLPIQPERLLPRWPTSRLFQQMSASTKRYTRHFSYNATPEVTQPAVGTRHIQLTPILWLLHSRGLWTCVTEVLMMITMYLNAFVWSTQKLPRPIRDLLTLSRKHTLNLKRFISYSFVVRTTTVQKMRVALKVVKTWKPKSYKCNLKQQREFPTYLPYVHIGNTTYYIFTHFKNVLSITYRTNIHRGPRHSLGG